MLKNLVGALWATIFNPLLALIFVAGLLVFLFGVVEFLFELNVRGNQSAKEAGKQHMLWGIVGMFVMMSAYAILLLIANIVGQPIT